MKLYYDEQRSFYHEVKCLINLDSDHISFVSGKKNMVYCFFGCQFSKQHETLKLVPSSYALSDIQYGTREEKTFLCQCILKLLYFFPFF